MTTKMTAITKKAAIIPPAKGAIKASTLDVGGTAAVVGEVEGTVVGEVEGTVVATVVGGSEMCIIII